MKLIFPTVLLFAAILFYQCTRPATTASNNFPNKDSELALLMREMELDALSIKGNIEKNKDITNDVRQKFKAIHTAIATDASMRNPAFEAMANNFLQALDKLYTLPKNERKEQYTIFVNDCINCHKMYCPGPIVRIKKLNMTK